MQTYELVAILDPRMDADQSAAAVAKIENAVTAGEGELLANEDWGVRRLAYPIKQFREGNYILRKIRIESSEAISLNQTLRMAEEVIRYLIVKVDNDILKVNNDIVNVDSDIVKMDSDIVKVDSDLEEA